MLTNDAPSKPSTAKTVRPGTWHDSAPDVAVARPIAMTAWESVATGILKGVASTYGATVTYGDLKNRLFDETGYRTRQLVSNWISPALGAIQRETHSLGLPPLTSLVVHAATGQVGAGYITHGHEDGFENPREREEAAAADRLACYREYADNVPGDAQPQLTDRYRSQLERDRRAAKRDAPGPAPCPTCGVSLPATGRCDECAG